MAVQDRAQTTAAASSTPVITQDDDKQYDDDGIPYVNTNVPGADIATGDKQSQILAALLQLAGGIPVTVAGVVQVNPGTVAVLLAPNAAGETAGNLQRIADALELILQELQVHSALISQLGQPVQDGADQLRNDFKLMN